jgi:hypothetical protein
VEKIIGTVSIDVHLTNDERKAVKQILGKDVEVLKDAKLIVTVEMQIEKPAGDSGA